MSHIQQHAIAGAAGMGMLGALGRAGSAGPLTPPAGPISSSGRTLDEIYDRVTAPPPPGGYDGRIPIPARTTPLTISQPGSYVLTGDITLTGGSSATGVTISASGITLDLNGYSITSDGSGNGVSILATGSSIVVRNGRIRGFETAVMIAANSAGHLLEDLLVHESYSAGINSLGRSTVVRRCTLVSLGGGVTVPSVVGIWLNGDAGVAEQCAIGRFASTAASPLYVGIQVGGIGCVVSRCSITNDVAVAGFGMQITRSPTIYRDNTVINLATKYFIGAGVTAIAGGQNV